MQLTDVMCPCGTPFQARTAEINRGYGKFCSTACSAKYGNSIRPLQSKLITCFNPACNKETLKRPSQLARHKSFYCGVECKRVVEFKGNQPLKRTGKHRKLHIRQRAALIKEYGIICQFPHCDLDLANDLSMVDMHHFDGTLNHQQTRLLCPYHHRLADRGYIRVLETGEFAWDQTNSQMQQNLPIVKESDMKPGDKVVLISGGPL